MSALISRARRLSATFTASDVSMSPRQGSPGLPGSEESSVPHWRNDGHHRASMQDMVAARDACIKGDLAGLEKMVRNNPEALFAKDPRGGQTCAHRAAASGQKEVLRFLYRRNRHVLHVKDDVRGFFPAHYCARSGHDEVLADIAEHHPQCLKMPDDHGRTPLDLAMLKGARDGSIKKIKAMMLLSPDSIKAIEYEYDHGYTTAHLAASHGHLQALKFILEVGPELAHEKDSHGNTILRCAEIGGHSQVVDFLLRREGKIVDCKMGEIIQ